MVLKPTFRTRKHQKTVTFNAIKMSAEFGENFYIPINPEKNMYYFFQYINGIVQFAN